MRLPYVGIGFIAGGLITLGSITPAQALIFNPSSAGGTINASGSSNFYFNVSASGTYQTNSVTLTIHSLGVSDLSELEIYLISPAASGSRALSLVDYLSLSTMTNTFLSDTGLTTIDTGISPYNDTFMPQGGGGFYLTGSGDTFAAAFAGIDPIGTWTLRIYNDDTNSGTLGTVTLNIDATESVPFEFSPTLGLLILGGWFGGRKLNARLKKSC